MRSSALAPLRFLLQSLIVQFISFAASSAILDLNPGWPVVLLSHGICAAALAVLIKLPMPWVIANAVLPFGLAVATMYQIESWVFTILLAALLLTYLPTFWTRVPYYPTDQKVFELVARELPNHEQFRFIDLGSGFAGMLIYLARRFPNAHFVGLELGPLPWLVSKFRSLFIRNLTIRFDDFWKEDLSAYRFVYAFLSPTPMPALWDKVCKEISPGSLFISNTFPTAGHADKIIDLNLPRQRALFLYRRYTEEN